MFSKKKKHEHHAVNSSINIKSKENPKVCLEFLPDGKVLPSISWEAHDNVNVKLMADVINMLNEGKLWMAFKEATVHQGVVSGDVELAATLALNIKDPKSVEDERPLIRPSLVSRFHFSQQGNNEGDEE